MARVILHIGAHKTATTFLQRSFHRNRRFLAAHGIHYPDIGPNPAHHVLTTPWIDNPDFNGFNFGPGGPDGLWSRFVADHADRSGTVFLSGEPFSRLAPQQVDMAALAARLAPFEDVRIVYTARRQSELIQSIWLQTVKSRLSDKLGEFIKRACSLHMVTGVPVDHGLILDHVLSGFAPEQVTILDYEQIRRAPGGVLQVFLDLVGSGLKAEALESVGQSQANISPDPLGMYVYGRIAPKEAPDAGELARIVAAIKEGHSAPTTVYTRKEFDHIRDVFAPLNAAFEAKVRRCQPDFTLTPEVQEPEFTWRGDLSMTDWARIAAAVSRL